MSRIASRQIAVAVPVPFVDLLTYRVPPGIESPVIGARVLVPLGPRQVTGVVVAAGSGIEDPATVPVSPTDIKDLVDVLDGSPFVPADVVRLALWASEYYACGPGEAIAAAMPPLAWIESECLVQLTDNGAARVVGRRAGPRATGREELLTALAGGRWIAVRTLAARLAASRAKPRARVPVRALVHLLEREHLVRTETVLRGRTSA
ncbi:MAG: hypothetical protein IMZ67_00760, partial [Acidobacteria bacterium]|nr:hypothetical protein [Acidobacteriota bacterium]